MIRAVVDTNVVVSGILNPRGRPAAVLQSAGVAFELVWSPALVVECFEVLDYPKLKKALAGRHRGAREIVANLAALAAMFSLEALPSPRVVSGDPDDDLLFGTALAGGASVIVSGDAAVLGVGSYAGVTVLDAAEFLARLGEKPSR